MRRIRRSYSGIILIINTIPSFIMRRILSTVLLACLVLGACAQNKTKMTEEEKKEVEIQVKYEGYIKLEEAQVEKFKKLENKKLPKEIDYSELSGLRIEARQKLNKIKPESVGQASRISGVSPADISVLLIYLEQLKRR